MNRLPLAVLTAFAAAFLIACSEKPAMTSNAAKPPEPSAPTRIATQAATAPSLRNYDQALKNKLPGIAFGGIDVINGKVLPKSHEAVEVAGDVIAITGNFIDYEKKDAAAWVFFVVGDKVFPASARSDRPDIAKTHGSEKYLSSQFAADIPTAAVGRGVFPIAVRVISSDKSGFYESGALAKVSVK
jgi:hypothetical protein